LLFSGTWEGNKEKVNSGIDAAHRALSGTTSILVGTGTQANMGSIY